jgi:hypothetical protein
VFATRAKRPPPFRLRGSSAAVIRHSRLPLPVCFSFPAQASVARKVVPLADRVLVKRVELQAKVRRILRAAAAGMGRGAPRPSETGRLRGVDRRGAATEARRPSHPSLPSLPPSLRSPPLQTASGILLPETGKKLNEGEVRY